MNNVFNELEHVDSEVAPQGIPSISPFVSKPFSFDFCCEAGVEIGFKNFELAAGQKVNVTYAMESAPSENGPWTLVQGVEPSCLAKTLETLENGALSGTLSDGTTYNIGSDIGTTIDVQNANEIQSGDVRQPSNVRVRFDSPVCIVMKPSVVGAGATWHEAPAQGVTTATTDGTPWVFVPGSQPSAIEVNGQVAAATDTATGPGSSVDSRDDWGSLSSDGVTEFTFSSWIFDTFTLEVYTEPEKTIEAIAIECPEAVECLVENVSSDPQTVDGVCRFFGVDLSCVEEYVRFAVQTDVPLDGELELKTFCRGAIRDGKRGPLQVGE